MKRYFTNQLLKWHRQSNRRKLPWKGEKDPYKIWLSEIILQQTRVEQGVSYYEKFINKYPEINLLADAPEDEVLKMWQGLGYYSRARNLHSAAQYVTDTFGGEFPKDYDSIRKLKGVGDYTAAAISSFAYNLPHAVVDGNVYRLLTRYFAVDEPVDTAKGKKIIADIADELINIDSPAEYNQAIMDFGASVCKPKNPLCNNCVFKLKCKAFKERRQEYYPVKKSKIKIKDRYFHYLLIFDDENTLLKKRTEKDIWQGLYDLPLIEKKEGIDEGIDNSPEWETIFNESTYVIEDVSKTYQQILSHQKIYGKFWAVRVIDLKKINKKTNFIKIYNKNLHTFAFPLLIDRYFRNEGLIF